MIPPLKVIFKRAVIMVISAAIATFALDLSGIKINNKKEYPLNIVINKAGQKVELSPAGERCIANSYKIELTQCSNGYDCINGSWPIKVADFEKQAACIEQYGAPIKKLGINYFGVGIFAVITVLAYLGIFKIYAHLWSQRSIVIKIFKAFISKVNTPTKRKALLALPFLMVTSMFSMYRDTSGFGYLDDISLRSVLLLMASALCAALAFGNLSEWVKNG